MDILHTRLSACPREDAHVTASQESEHGYRVNKCDMIVKKRFLIVFNAALSVPMESKNSVLGPQGMSDVPRFCFVVIDRLDQSCLSLMCHDSGWNG